MTRVFATLTLFLACLTSAFADNLKVGDLIFADPIIRASAPGAKVASGYLMIENTGQEADRLLGGEVTYAKQLQVHEMKMSGENNSIMRMNRIEGGLEIAPGQKVHLAPGGNHIMFMKLTEPLVAGEVRKVTLQFDKAGPIELSFNVKSIADTMKHKMKMKSDSDS